VVQAAVALIATGAWALFDTHPVGGLFYFPANIADALLHFATSTIFVAGAVHFFARQAPVSGATVSDSMSHRSGLGGHWFDIGN